MIQNIWFKFQSFFNNNSNNKRSISHTAAFLTEEAPAKKLKLDHLVGEYFDMNENNRNKKDLFSQITRNVTTRNDLEKTKTNGYKFPDTFEKSDYSYCFQKDTNLDGCDFQGSPNIRYKSTPKNSIYEKIFSTKNKIKDSRNIKKKLTTNECIRLKEKSEYEALVTKYSSGQTHNINTFFLIKASNNNKSPNKPQFVSQVINIDKEDSNQAIITDFEIPEVSLNRTDKENSLASSIAKNTPIAFNVSDDNCNFKVLAKNNLKNDNIFFKYDNFMRDRLKQSYRPDSYASVICKDADYPVDGTNRLASSLIINKNCPMEKTRYKDLSYLTKIERRLERTSRVLNDVISNNKLRVSDVISNNKLQVSDVMENNHLFNPLNDEIIIIDEEPNMSLEKQLDKIIDVEENTLRRKDIHDFSSALDKSPYSNQQYLSNLCRPVVDRDLREAFVKGEAEINFYKNLRQIDEEKMIYQMNKILQISKRISPPIDESVLFIDNDEDEDVELVEEEEIEDEFIDLTSEQEQRVSSVFKMGMSEKVAVTAFRLQITYKDLSTLADLNWLNDEVINFYMNLIVDRDNTCIYTFNTFFYPKIASEGQKSVRRWTKNIDIFAYKTILVPIHLGVHWCLAVIDFDKKQIRYYDSMGGNNQHCLHTLQTYLQDEHQDKKGSDYNLKEWQKIIVKDIPQQMNGSDCGMFACKFAEYYARGANINFNQNHMTYFRKRMVLEIIDKRLW